MAKEEKSKKNKHFFKDLRAELKKVIWPTSKQIVNSTLAVITIVLISAVIVIVLDLIFLGANTYGINKLKTKLQSSQPVETTSEVTENVVDENVNTAEQNVIEGSNEQE